MTPETRTKWLVVGAACVVGVFVVDRFVLSPLAAHWTSRSERIVSLRAELAESQALLERSEQLRSRWREMQQGALPSNPGDAEGLILSRVDRWAAASGLSITALKPQWRADAEPPVLACAASGTGTLAQIVRFVHALESSDLGIHVEELGLSAEDETGSTLRIALRFTGIVLEAEAS